MKRESKRYSTIAAVTLILPTIAMQAVAGPTKSGVQIESVSPGETLRQYASRHSVPDSASFFQGLIAAASPFKEGDLSIGVGAADEISRQNARTLLGNTTLSELNSLELHEDSVSELARSSVDPVRAAKVASWTVAQLKNFLLTSDEAAIHEVMPGLSSEAIGAVVKLMSDAELTQVSRKVFNPLPGSKIGSRGYMSARVQPNSPTENPEDIAWQVFNAWSFGVGDLMLGTNPVSGDPQKIEAVETTLKDIVTTFGREKDMPWVVLSHIDTQAQVEKNAPGSTALWFQSIAGTTSTNEVFDLAIPKLLKHVDSRNGSPFALYFETGQGSEFTNHQDHGMDMAMLESRKYGLVRAMHARMKKAGSDPWIVVNDVAGFIGPEVFKSREQLVRVALEDTVMGKLHGLTIGLDICATLHMDIGPADLDWAIRRIMPANPAYLMALPTKNDPMLSYLTTAFVDHVRIREEFGYKVDDSAWNFFKKIGVIDSQGRPVPGRFGNPLWVYTQFKLWKGDTRPLPEIEEEGRQAMKRVQERGVMLADGHGEHPWDLKPELQAEVDKLVKHAKEVLWHEIPSNFVGGIPDALALQSVSPDRANYINNPSSGEVLDAGSKAAVESLKARRKSAEAEYDVQIVVSDGLNADAITKQGHLEPLLAELRSSMAAQGLKVAPEVIFVKNGRVRIGYQIGEILFGNQSGRSASVVHVIGERPGTEHDALSVYVASASDREWSRPGTVDHSSAKVISGVAQSALKPTTAARETLEALKAIWNCGQMFSLAP